MKYDYLVVGAGLFGATLAHELTKSGKKVLVLEKRDHIAGNIYTEVKNGISVHMYGPHIFHTNSQHIWEYINQFAQFNHFVNRIKAVYKGKIYSMPINLMTLNQIAGCITPQDAEKYLQSVKIPCKEPANLEDWIISQVGVEVYEILIKGYTTKQWQRSPKKLPASIIQRLPIRTTYDDNYYNSYYQGIPIGGYTQIIKRMLEGIQVELNVDFETIKHRWNDYANRLIYSGPIDGFFDNIYGQLEYRTLKFEHEEHKGDYQGNTQINYTDEEVPYTRIIEHKHFEFIQSNHTIITKEYPIPWQNGCVPYYPINDQLNKKLYQKYNKIAKNMSNVIFGGRLGSYKYYDMDQIIAQAISIFKRIYN